jgi:hypothetical protein
MVREIGTSAGEMSNTYGRDSQTASGATTCDGRSVGTDGLYPMTPGAEAVSFGRPNG